MGATATAKDDLKQLNETTDDFFREWWELCERDVVHLGDASTQRLLSKEETDSARTLIEIMAQLDTSKAKRGWWYRMRRRAELTRKYLKQ